MKDYYETKESSYINYWDLNYLYGWAISQKLPVNKFKWEEETSQLNNNFIKNYDEKSEEGYILEVDVQYRKKLYELHWAYHFYLKKNLKKLESLSLIYVIKLNMFYT